MNKKFDGDEKSLVVIDIKDAYWIFMIRELVDGAGYSYSRIAKRIGVSPSTIQKLATHQNRQPRHLVFHKILCLYHKVFFGPFLTEKVKLYLANKNHETTPKLPFEWLDFLKEDGGEEGEE